MLFLFQWQGIQGLEKPSNLLEVNVFMAKPEFKSKWISLQNGFTHHIVLSLRQKACSEFSKRWRQWLEWIIHSIAQLCDIPPPPQSQQRFDSTLFHSSCHRCWLRRPTGPQGGVFTHLRKQIADITGTLPLDCLSMCTASLGNCNSNVEVCVESFNIFLNSQWWKTPITTQVKAYGCGKISSVDLTGKDSWLNMACMPEPNFLWWENYLESSGHLWSSWVKLSAGRHSCYQSTCAVQQASGALVGCCSRRHRGSLCGEEMASDLDGLLEAGSGRYQVSAAYESAGFSPVPG